MVIDMFYNDIGKNLGTVNTSAITQNKSQAYAKNHTAECNCKEVLSIKFKGDFFEIGKTKGIYNKTNKSFSKKMSSEKNNSRGKKWKKDDKNTQGQIITGKLAYDNCNTRSSVVNCIIGKQNTGNRKACNQCTCNNCEVRKEFFEFFVQ